jgi:hypothetical protein
VFWANPLFGQHSTSHRLIAMCCTWRAAVAFQPRPLPAASLEGLSSDLLGVGVSIRSKGKTPASLARMNFSQHGRMRYVWLGEVPWGESACSISIGSLPIVGTR